MGKQSIKPTDQNRKAVAIIWQSKEDPGHFVVMMKEVKLQIEFSVNDNGKGLYTYAVRLDKLSQWDVSRLIILIQEQATMQLVNEAIEQSTKILNSKTIN